jgi:hypothetical protein
MKQCISEIIFNSHQTILEITLHFEILLFLFVTILDNLEGDFFKVTLPS